MPGLGIGPGGGGGGGGGLGGSPGIFGGALGGGGGGAGGGGTTLGGGGGVSLGLPAGPLGAPAEHIHRQKADTFARDAIRAFLQGKVTRSQLAEALSDEGQYDFAEWSKSSVVHPSRAVSAGVAAEPEVHGAVPQMPL